MKILVLDDDTTDMPHFCEGLEQLGHEVWQVIDHRTLEAQMVNIKPDALLLDLMLPAIGLPAHECEQGFTAGFYVYENMIKPQYPELPFVILTGAVPKVNIIQQCISSLKQERGFRGVLRKPCTEEEVLDCLQGGGDSSDVG